MGLLLTKSINGARLGIWEVTESLEDLRGKVRLTGLEREFFASLQSPLRKKHWLSYRLILPHILRKMPPGGIFYDSFGKPRIVNGAGQISVSHSGRYSVMIASRNKSVGVDIEKVDDKIFRLAHKFLSPGEMEYSFGSFPTESLMLIWCAKEAMYKLHGRGGLSFSRDLFVERFSFEGSGTVTGHIKSMHRITDHQLHYESIDNYLLVYTIAGT